MEALVFHGIGDIRVDDVDDPRIEQPTDAVVRVTASAVCGTDLHMRSGLARGATTCSSSGASSTTPGSTCPPRSRTPCAV